MAVMLSTRQEFGRRSLRARQNLCAFGQYPIPRRPPGRSKLPVDDKSRRRKSSTLVVLSARMRKCTSKSIASSEQRWCVFENIAPDSTIDPRPAILESPVTPLEPDPSGIFNETVTIYDIHFGGRNTVVFLQLLMTQPTRTVNYSKFVYTVADSRTELKVMFSR